MRLLFSQTNMLPPAHGVNRKKNHANTDVKFAHSFNFNFTRPFLKEKFVPAIGPSEQSDDFKISTQSIPKIQAIDKDHPIELLTLLQKLSEQADTMAWSRWASNLEGELNTEFGNYTVRLSRNERSIPNYPQFDFQVFKKNNFFSSSILFALEDIGHDSFPTGSRLNSAYQKALKSMPELKMGSPGSDRHFQTYQIGDSPYTVSYTNPNAIKNYKNLGKIPHDLKWLFLVRRSESLETHELKKNNHFIGYIDQQDFHVLAPHNDLQSDFLNTLSDEEINLNQIMLKGKELFTPPKKPWPFF